MFSPFGLLLPVAENPDIQYAREMGVTHSDFFRILPAAMGSHSYRVEGNAVYVQLYEGSAEIKIGVQQERRIALMCIPFAEVSFHFRDVTKEQQEAFKAHFDLRFQRGGG